MNFKQKLLQHCAQCAANELELGKVAEGHHAEHSALADSLDDGEHKKRHEAIAALHKRGIAAHASNAESWIGLHKMIDAAPMPDVTSEGRRGSGGDLDGPKAFGGRDFRRAVDDGVSGIAPDHSDRVTLVPRYGGPDPNEINKAAVPEQHRHLIEPDR